MTDDKKMPIAEIDVISFVDDDGNEFDMECVYVFEHNSKTYALLAESIPEHEHTHEDGDECGCGEEEAFYIFEVKEDEDGAEYLAVEDDALLDELIGVIENLGIFEDEDAD